VLCLFPPRCCSGALTKGDRRAATGADLSQFNFDTPYGRNALRQMYSAICEVCSTNIVIFISPDIQLFQSTASPSAFPCIDLFRAFFFQSRIFPGVALSAVLTLANASKEYNLAEFIEIMQVCCIYRFINLTALFLPVILAS
jgi:hypothetical protein